MTRRSPSDWAVLAAGMAALAGVGVWLGLLALDDVAEMNSSHLVGLSLFAMGWMAVWVGAFKARTSVTRFGQGVAILGLGALLWGSHPLVGAVTVAVAGLVGLNGWRRLKLEGGVR